MELSTHPFIKQIKEAKLDSLLKLISDVTVKMFKEGNVIVPLVGRKKIGGLIREFKQHLTIWNLMEIAYFAINNTTDHRKHEPVLYDLFELHNKYIAYSEYLIKEEEIGKYKNAFFYAYMFGLGNKQILYQKIFKNPELKYHVLRYFLLLYSIPHNIDTHRTPHDDCKEITGLDLRTLCRLIETMVLYNLQVRGFLNDEDLGKIANQISEKHGDYTFENLKKVRNYFVGDYEFYRKEHPIRNPFIFKPIIKTKTNNYVVSCIHIWFQKMIEGVYWIIRDYYLEKKSEYFLERFGYYFEEYVSLLLSFYLPRDMYRKIEVEKEDSIKRADWFIHTSKYVLIIEQKSGLMPVKYKEENFDLEGLEDYFLNAFKRGIEQLNNTEADYKNEKNKIVKLLLHFEYLNFGEGIVKEHLASVCEKKGIFDKGIFNNLFFIEIGEFELLIQILGENEKLFNKIIEKKFALNEIKSIQDGKEFYIPIQEFYDKKEVTFLEEKFSEYEDFIKLE